MKAVTLTVYLMVDEDERVSKWDIAACIGPEVVGWDITDGHGDCTACASNEHEVVA